MLLVIALVVTITSWVTSQHNQALAQGGGGSESGQWMMATATFGEQNEGLLYMFNTDKQVLLVYAFYRYQSTGKGSNRYEGHLHFLAGRLCKWDLLFSQLKPYNLEERFPRNFRTPEWMKKAFEHVTQGE